MTTPTLPIEPAPGCRRLFPWLLAGALLIPGLSWGQAVRSPSAAGPAGDEVVELSTFEVQEDSDTSYGAVNSNSITRFNTPLNEMPVSADVFTESFMRDVGATSVEELVANFTAGGGYTTNDPGSDAAALQEGDRQATSSVTVRGLMSPTLRRDGFIQLGSLTNPGSTGQGFTSNFDIERVEVINGPQSLLYGSGGSGGVLNTISKQARFRRKPYGSFQFRVGQYGNKSGQIDYGMGTANFAVRLAAIKEEVAGRRLNIGGPVDGYYLQLAARLPARTIVRLTGGWTNFDRLYNAGLTLNAGNANNDSRHGQQLKYLIASGQVMASATGNSNAGPLLGGALDWDNADSFAGWHRTERSKNEYVTLTAETRWTDWLTTDLSVGYNNFEDRLKSAGGGAFLTPNNASNPTGTWASTVTGATIWKPTRTSTARFAAVATHRLWGDRGRSQTMFGADFNRSEQTQVNYNLFRADADWNIIGHENTRTALPTQYYSIADGPVKKPLFDPFVERVTINGVNYVRDIINQVDPARISPENPLGVTLGGNVYQFTELKATGIYLVNHTNWMDNKLTTLVGARYDDSVLQRKWSSQAGTLRAASENLNFNVGVNYAVRDWLRPYAAYSSSFNPPLEAGIGPDGKQVETSHAKGAEVGVKIQNRRATISGTITYFYLNAENEQQRIPSQLITAINPNGRNGQHGAASTWANVNRKSDGLQAAVTYNPSRNWRMRLSAAVTDGTVGSTKVYDQFYNDEFHANAAGQVTYQDGTLVHVPGTPSTTTPVVPAGTPGAVPLTIAMMNTPGNPYYANPAPVSGAISASSAVARVLNVSDLTHGPILTGRTGLPISALQINPGFTPPGTVTTAVAGEKTTGYAQYAITYTNMYTFSSGWLRGFRVGGTVSLGWRNRAFYYYPEGTAGANPKREAFYWPDNSRVNLTLGYEHRFQRVTFSTQLNINNAFNNYDVIIVPNAITGWAGIRNATFRNEPRAYVWSTTLRF